MKKKNLFNKLENFESHNKVLVFAGVMVLTVFLIRLSVFIYNPNITTFGFELHHFDYGIILLMISVLLLLFGNKKYLLLSAVAFGVVLDDLWFIRSNMLDPSINEIPIYNATLPVVVMLVIIFVLVALWINHSKKN